MEKLSLGVGNKTITAVMSVQVCHNVKSQRDQSSLRPTFSHDAIGINGGHHHIVKYLQQSAREE